MRSFYIVSFFAVLFLITALPGPVHATGNVLLPSNQDNSSDDDTNATGSSNEPSTESSDDASPPNDDSRSSAPAAMPAPPATPTAPNATPTTKRIDFPNATPPTVPTTKSDVKAPPSPKIPTSVYKVNQPSKDMSAAWGKNLPNALSVGFANSPTIGTRDTSTIKSRLGIPESSIKDVCSLVLNGHVRTDKRSYMPPFNAFSPHFIIKYDGQLKTTWLNVMAACNKTALPKNSGTIIQIGDKYLLPLSQVSCPAPAQAVKQLGISYTGDGQGQCAYQ